MDPNAEADKVQGCFAEGDDDNDDDDDSGRNEENIWLILTATSATQSHSKLCNSYVCPQGKT